MKIKTLYFCLGFAFVQDKVLLIRKTHPEWQSGKFNGVGGSVEDVDGLLQINETNHPVEHYIKAMVREMKEETKVDTTESQWRVDNQVVYKNNTKEHGEETAYVNIFFTDLTEEQTNCLYRNNALNQETDGEFLSLFDWAELRKLDSDEKLVRDTYIVVRNNLLERYKHIE